MGADLQNPSVGASMAALRTAIQLTFSSDVSAKSGNVRVGVFSINAFSPPPISGGAVSSMKNPLAVLPKTISPSGKASYTQENTPHINCQPTFHENVNVTSSLRRHSKITFHKDALTIKNTILNTITGESFPQVFSFNYWSLHFCPA